MMCRSHIESHQYQFEGLKILLAQINSVQGKSNSNIVVCKPSLIMRLSTTAKSNDEFSCFLKKCYLCNKKLSLEKEVYMYRGDLGFCSTECRNKQIVLDEMKELESSTKHMLASYRHNYCRSEDRRETQLLLEELRRHRHNTNKPPPAQKVHWAIVS